MCASMPRALTTAASSTARGAFVVRALALCVQVALPTTAQARLPLLLGDLPILPRAASGLEPVWLRAQLLFLPSLVYCRSVLAPSSASVALALLRPREYRKKVVDRH